MIVTDNMAVFKSFENGYLFQEHFGIPRASDCQGYFLKNKELVWNQDALDLKDSSISSSTDFLNDFEAR